MTHPTRNDVRQTWERIGPHFAQTRANPWPEVETFCTDRNGTTALDIGCGNGRHAELLIPGFETVIGLDASRTLLNTAQNRLNHRATLIHGDATALPIATNTIDLALLIATLHHLPTSTARTQAITELSRVLTTDGRALISVWSTAHNTFDQTTGFDTTIEWTLPDGTTVDRYYHIYDPTEFQTVLNTSPITLYDFTVSSGNCYATIGPPE